MIIWTKFMLLSTVARVHAIAFSKSPRSYGFFDRSRSITTESPVLSVTKNDIDLLNEDGIDWKELRENKVGSIIIKNSQRKYPVDTERLRHYISHGQEYLGYGNWDCNVWLTTDQTVKTLNSTFRNSNKSTDILSFSYNEVISPGNLAPVTLPEEMDLGEMIISLAYVNRVCKEDKKYFEKLSSRGEHIEYERGVSGAMSRVFTIQERLPLLCIHGLLHLVGYDHETDEDYEIMVAKEEELIEKILS